MRTDLLYLVLGISALAVTACSASGAESNVEAAPTKRVLEVPELMIHVVDPAARSFWKGYSEVLDENGWQDISPNSEADWKRVEDGAATLIISGHLLLQPEYTREPVADWSRLAQEFLNLSSEGKAQAEGQSKDAMLLLGERLDESCDSCHAQFAPHVD